MSDARPNVTVHGLTYGPSRSSWNEEVWVGEITDGERLTALAVGASFAHNWGGPHDSLSYAATATGGIDAGLRARVIAGLHDWWGITDGPGAVDCARRLHAGMHAPRYQLISPLSVDAAAVSDELEFLSLRDRHRTFITQAHTLIGESPDSSLHTYEQWTQAQRVFKPRLPWPTPTRLASWDLVRSVFVVRAAFTADYISEHQAWNLLSDGVNIARAEYGNWKQLGDGYVLGFMIWQSQSDLSSWERGAQQRAALVNHLHVDPTSPWRRVALHTGERVVPFGQMPT